MTYLARWKRPGLSIQTNMDYTVDSHHWLQKDNLLATNGKMLLLGRTGSVETTENFAVRNWDSLRF